MTLPGKKEYVLFDFSKPDDIAQWYARDDTVMGGISASQLRATNEGNAAFVGEVSLENNGGFAAIRSRDALYDLSAYTGIMLYVKGDAKTYSINIRTDVRQSGLRYQANFKAVRKEWMFVLLPFQNFVAARRGQRPLDAPPLDLQHVRSFGFIIANKQVGPFRLELASIKAY
jgi:hypothetical protein